MKPLNARHNNAFDDGFCSRNSVMICLFHDKTFLFQIFFFSFFFVLTFEFSFLFISDKMHFRINSIKQRKNNEKQKQKVEIIKLETAQLQILENQAVILELFDSDIFCQMIQPTAFSFIRIFL